MTPRSFTKDDSYHGPFSNGTEHLAWAAGFLEGEGCFGCYGGTPRTQRPGPRTPALVVSAVQKEREPLDRLQELFGGRINHSAGRWEWRVNGRAAVPLMVRLHPFMSVRRQGAIDRALATHADSQRQIAERNQTCRRGHRWDEEGGRLADGRRYCRRCAREYQARRRKDAA